MLGTPWEMTLPSATYLICASNSYDKLAAQLHKMCPPYPSTSHCTSLFAFFACLYSLEKRVGKTFRLSAFIYASTFWQSIAQFFLNASNKLAV